MAATKPAGLSVKNAKDIDNPWLQVFLMGDIGSGKTTLASTFPRPLFIVPIAENSMNSLKGSNFDYIEVDSRDNELKNGVGGMNKVIQAIEMLYVKDMDAFPYDTIVLEQVGHYCDILQRDITAGTMSMDQQKWGLLLRHLLDIQAKLRRLQCHLVWTCHTKIEKLTDTASLHGPNMPGQAATKIPSSCDIVAYCEQGSRKNKRPFKVHFENYMKFPARSRFHHPSVIDSCTFNEIQYYVSPATEEG